MKKLLPFLVLCAATQVSHAQSVIKAGTVALGGSINYAHNGEASSSSRGGYGNYSIDFSSNTLAITPAVSYFVVDNLSIGLDLNYAIQETKVKYSSPSTTTTRKANSLRVGPFVQYYKMLSDQFGFTGTLGAGYEHSSRQPDGNPGINQVTLKADGFYAALTPGLIFLPIPKLGIGASIGGLGYSRLSIKPESNAPSDYSDIASTFGASFGLAQLTFSGTYFFGR